MARRTERTEYLYLDRRGEPEIRYTSRSPVFTADPENVVHAKSSAYVGPSRQVDGVRFDRAVRQALLDYCRGELSDPPGAVAAVIAFVDREAEAFGLDAKSCWSRVVDLARKRNEQWGAFLDRKES